MNPKVNFWLLIIILLLLVLFIIAVIIFIFIPISQIKGQVATVTAEATSASNAINNFTTNFRSLEAKVIQGVSEAESILCKFDSSLPFCTTTTQAVYFQ